LSGLVQRLVGQALGTSGQLRVRPAASVQPQAPLGTPAEVEQAAKIMPDIPRIVDTAPRADHQRVSAKRETNQRPVTTPEPVLPTAQDVPRVGMARVVARERNAAPDFPTPRIRDLGERTPARLLREQPTAAAPAAAGMPLLEIRTAREAVSNHATAEATEVHVHIGRIEVVAAPEPAKQQKKTRESARSTPPLADYLARRRRP